MTQQSGLDDFYAALAKWIEAALAYMRPNLDRYVITDVETPWRLNDDGFYRRQPIATYHWGHERSRF